MLRNALDYINIDQREKVMWNWFHEILCEIDFRKKNSPILGIAICMKWCSSWLFASSCRPSKSFSKTSWGTLHPHPLRSAKRVKRKWASKSWARGSKGLLIANALVLVGWPPAISNWAACWAACWAMRKIIIIRLFSFILISRNFYYYIN